mmetsp:Transcript_10438/g.31394  ORF Transcript_10438/g.31394 Transcript_10438/m.31394 type:complete len:488 (-) Transcript_10438:1191-2654(-)
MQHPDTSGGPPPKKAKLWGGRFRGDTDPVMEKFNNSLRFDKRMWEEDLTGSAAYARAIHRAGIITLEERDVILRGLDKVRQEWESGTFVVVDGDEDIHTANERRLTEFVGDAGKKLHTGRSRNDQVATDVRLWLRRHLATAGGEVCTLLEVMCDIAEQNIEILMAGYTHLQPAQPVRFSHWVMSHASAILRDAQRLTDLMNRVNVLPLGCGALAGHAFGIDRDALAQDLGFGEVSLNSLDTVCDRDFVAETLWWASMMQVHLSQVSEDLIVLNLQRCVEISDAYATGSSLMPQKKNPDALELLRGKAGRLLGHQCGFMATLKGLPRSYNKDLQEDKEPLFDTIDTVHDVLQISAGVFATLKPRPMQLLETLMPEMLATDLAEYLVRKGVPFRETHHIAGAAVKMAEDLQTPLSSLTVEQLQTLHSSFEDDVIAEVFDFEKSVERKSSIGGTSKRSVMATVMRIRQFVDGDLRPLFQRLNGDTSCNMS